MLDGFPAQTMLMPMREPEQQICTRGLSFPDGARAHREGHVMLGAMKLIIRWLLLAAALLIVPAVLPAGRRPDARTRRIPSTEEHRS